jgi:hypothetical protein
MNARPSPSPTSDYTQRGLSRCRPAQTRTRAGLSAASDYPLCTYVSRCCGVCVVEFV